MSRVVAIVLAIIEEDVAQKFMQHIRDFDVANPNCDFSCRFNAPDTPVEKVQEWMTVMPPFPFQMVIKREVEETTAELKPTATNWTGKTN